MMSDHCGRSECSFAPTASCIGKAGTQSVDISQPVILTPTASLGTVVTSCPGAPCVTCVTAPDGTSCTLTLTQRVCISIPVSYGVEASTGEPTIACAENGCSC